MDSQQETSASSQNQIIRRLANLRFREDFPQQEIQDIRLIFWVTIFQNEWTFENQQFNNLQAHRLFEGTQTILINALTLYYCQKPNILKQISNIGFPQLQILSLCGNQIESLEPLSCLYAENTQQINLKDNFITSLKPLRKCQFRMLKKLDLSNNRLISFSQIWENIDLSRIQSIMLFGNQRLFFTYGFAKSQLNSNKMRSLLMSCDKNQSLQNKLKIVLQHMGLKRDILRII